MLGETANPDRSGSITSDRTLNEEAIQLVRESLDKLEAHFLLRALEDDPVRLELGERSGGH